MRYRDFLWRYFNFRWWCLGVFTFSISNLCPRDSKTGLPDHVEVNTSVEIPQIPKGHQNCACESCLMHGYDTVQLVCGAKTHSEHQYSYSYGLPALSHGSSTSSE